MTEYVWIIEVDSDGTFSKQKVTRESMKNFTTNIKTDSSSADTKESRPITAYDVVTFIRNYRQKGATDPLYYTQKNYSLHLQAWREFSSSVLEKEGAYDCSYTTETLGDGEKGSEVFITTRHTYEQI